MPKYNLDIEKNSSKNKKKAQKIGNIELLSHPKFFFAASCGALGYFLYGFMEPILAFRVGEFQMD
tara:strand:- start:769 stop:963 length:195 start_codon:yes stop_codon:yes gene_type:complete